MGWSGPSILNRPLGIGLCMVEEAGSLFIGDHQAVDEMV